MAKKQSKATKQSNAARAAERAAALRAVQEKKQRRRRVLVVAGVVIVVLAVLVVIGFFVQSARDTTGQSANPPSGVVDSYALPLGENDAPVVVEVYEDFMCPFCGEFETLSSETLKGYADTGDVQVQYKVVSFLDSASNGSDYSTRAMNAVGVVLDQAGPDAAVALHDALYANQPEEGTSGLSDEELVDLAVEAGADRAAVEGPIVDREFEQWTENAGDQASRDGVNGTPTVLVNGETMEVPSIEALLDNTKTAVDAALAE